MNGLGIVNAQFAAIVLLRPMLRSATDWFSKSKQNGLRWTCIQIGKHVMLEMDLNMFIIKSVALLADKNFKT